MSPMADEAMSPPQQHIVSDRCDESKCVSKPFSHDGSFVCYGTHTVSRPMMCADGFLPVIVGDEPWYAFTPYVDSAPRAVANETLIDGETLWYFTCCPPEEEPLHTKELDATRHCSEPITVPSSTPVDGLCDDQGSQKYPRKMKPTLIAYIMECDSYVCCDSPVENEDDEEYVSDTEESSESGVVNTANFLEETECVPYTNEFYDSSNAQNQVGLLRPITCDFSNGDFPFPRPIGDGSIQDVASTGQYQCCKNGPALQPFIEDQGFKITVYPVVTLWSIAAVLSMLVAIGLLVPLLLQLRNGKFQQRTSLQMSRAFRKSDIGEARYSTYNLYVVYLAFLDVFISLVEIALYGSYMNQKFHRGFYGSLAIPWNSFGLPPELIISIFYAAANMWINAVICYEILVLLRSSRTAKKINQPSLMRVSLQVGVVIFFSAIYCTSVHLLFDASDQAMVACNFDKAKALKIVLYVLSGLVALPFVYVLYATISIWWCGYLPSIQRATAREKAMRELALFFFRIVAVFVVIWFPMVILFVSVYMSPGGEWAGLVCFCFMSAQPILTFGMILTKSDARRYIYRLVTLSYFRKANEAPEKRGSIFGDAKSWDVPTETCDTRNTSTRESYRQISNKGSITSFSSTCYADENVIPAVDSDSDIEQDGGNIAAEVVSDIEKDGGNIAAEITSVTSNDYADENFIFALDSDSDIAAEVFAQEENERDSLDVNSVDGASETQQEQGCDCDIEKDGGNITAEVSAQGDSENNVQEDSEHKTPQLSVEAQEEQGCDSHIEEHAGNSIATETFPNIENENDPQLPGEAPQETNGDCIQEDDQESGSLSDDDDEGSHPNSGGSPTNH